MRRSTIILFAILLLGFLARLGALHWNWFMHADVIDDVVVAASIHRDGRFSTYAVPTIPDPAKNPPLPASAALPIKMHGPLWPGLAAAVTAIRGGESTIADGFLSLRILSVIIGTLIIYLSFLVASRIVNVRAGLAVAAWTAASYILIDYSGNGALYSLQAVSYLLWILVALTAHSMRRTMLLGAIAGVSYLNNFQCIILVPATLIFFAVGVRPWPRFFLHAVMFLGVTAIIIGPWLLRNAVVFGDPFYSHAYNMGYVWGKAGFATNDLSFGDKLSVLHGVLTVWMPNNMYYAARKLFILAPFAFFFFAYGLLDVAFSPKRLTRTLPIVLLIVFQCLMYAGWPIWKFRFFVPLLPLVFIFAVEYLSLLRVHQKWKHVSVGITLLSLIVLSVLTYRAVPTHTVYYDGALTQDPFHGSEEETYLRKYTIRLH